MYTTRVDKISRLPEPIQHHILSLLDAKEAFKTSILSKTWRAIALSLPIVDCRQSYFKPKHKTRFFLNPYELITMELSFDNHVQECIHRLTALKSTIHKVNIELEIYIQGRSGPKIDGWIRKLATEESRIKEFSLIINYYDQSPEPIKYYQLPPVVLCLKTITNLRLCCQLKDSYNVDLPNLLKLRLERVALSQGDIDNFISGCPSLEILELWYCTGLSSICVSGLARLNTLVLVRCRNLTQARIVAPMLLFFEFWTNPIFNKDQKYIVDLLACESTLRVLRLLGTNMTKESLRSCVSNFLYLDQLFLRRLDLESIEISNQNIRKLEITDCHELEKVEIAAPDRLQVLKFVNNKLPFYSVSSKSSLNDTIDFYGSSYMSLMSRPLLTNWTNSFENFFVEFNKFKDIEMVFHDKKNKMIICEERDKDRFIKMLHHMKDEISWVRIIRRNLLLQ